MDNQQATKTDLSGVVEVTRKYHPDADHMVNIICDSVESALRVEDAIKQIVLLADRDLSESWAATVCLVGERYGSGHMVEVQLQLANENAPTPKIGDCYYVRPSKPVASDECPVCHRLWTEHRLGYSASQCKMKKAPTTAANIGIAGLGAKVEPNRENPFLTHTPNPVVTDALIEKVAKSMWDAESKTLLENAGFTTSWDGQSEPLKKTWRNRASVAISSTLKECA